MNLSYKIGWLSFRAYYTVWHRWRVFNPERVPLEGPVILACNHASYIDPPLAGSGINRHISYLARETLFHIPVLATILRSWKVVPVDRDGGTGRGLKTILDRLEGGDAVILFPEGTRTFTGKLQPGRSGIGLTVIKSNAPVVPVRVFGTFEAYGKQMKWPRPRPLMVKYGHPLDFSKFREEARNCSRDRVKQIYQEVADQIMDAIGKLEPGKE